MNLFEAMNSKFDKLEENSKELGSEKRLGEIIQENFFNEDNKALNESLNEATDNYDWKQVVKEYCRKNGYELLFVNDDSFGYEDRDGNMIHKYVDELKAELESKDESLTEADSTNPVVILRADNDSYNYSQAAHDSCTVGELINALNNYPSNTPIILGFDKTSYGFYSYGAIDADRHLYDSRKIRIEESLKESKAPGKYVGTLTLDYDSQDEMYADGEKLEKSGYTVDYYPGVYNSTIKIYIQNDNFLPLEKQIFAQLGLSDNEELGEAIEKRNGIPMETKDGKLPRVFQLGFINRKFSNIPQIYDISKFVKALNAIELDKFIIDSKDVKDANISREDLKAAANELKKNGWKIDSTADENNIYFVFSKI